MLSYISFEKPWTETGFPFIQTVSYSTSVLNNKASSGLFIQLTYFYFLVNFFNPSVVPKSVILEFDLTVTDQEFTPELDDETSPEYRSLVDDVTTSVSVCALKVLLESAKNNVAQLVK